MTNALVSGAVVTLACAVRIAHAFHARRLVQALGSASSTGSARIRSAATVRSRPTGLVQASRGHGGLHAAADVRRACAAAGLWRRAITVYAATACWNAGRAARLARAGAGVTARVRAAVASSCFPGLSWAILVRTARSTGNTFLTAPFHRAAGEVADTCATDSGAASWRRTWRARGPALRD